MKNLPQAVKLALVCVICIGAITGIVLLVQAI